MNSKPTPGTWEAVPDPHNANNPYWHAVDIHAGPLLVARVQCTNAQRQGPANAAILAAAMDLFTILDRIANTAEEFTTDPDCDSDPYDLFEAILTEAREVLAKAEGMPIERKCGDPRNGAPEMKGNK